MRVLASRGIYLALFVLAHITGFGLFVGAMSTPARAQTIPRSLEEGGSDTAQRDRRNAWTVGIAGGQLSGTYMTFANELAEVLDDGDNLRIIPIVTYGAASNLDDLLYLRQVDLAITQADVFDYFRNQRKISNLESRVNYIVRLLVSEVHILAGTDVKTIDDLRGRRGGIYVRQACRRASIRPRCRYSACTILRGPRCPARRKPAGFQMPVPGSSTVWSAARPDSPGL
jgi:TRAP-type uncharacterized transport system substrate-binding protein